MKATGIVRRIDELGRVVIPKEIRKTLRLSSGDPLEIFTERDELLLKKYSPLKSIEGIADDFAKALHGESGRTCVICDTDAVVACAGGLKDLLGRGITKELERVMREGKVISSSKSEGARTFALVGEDTEYSAQAVAPIFSAGDCIGACMLLSSRDGDKMRESDIKLIKLSANLIARQFEG